jgi:hypothetical protein
MAVGLLLTVAFAAFMIAIPDVLALLLGLVLMDDDDDVENQNPGRKK